MTLHLERRLWLAAVLAIALTALSPSHANAQVQTPKPNTPASETLTTRNLEPPDAQRIKEELRRLLDGYPPSLRAALSLDSTLLTNQAYLAPYPALANYLNAHPEIVRNPAFYVGEMSPFPRQETNWVHDFVHTILGGLAALTVFGIVISVIIWFVRTIIDYRRWSRLAKVQTDAHSKLLDRFTSNEDLLRYMQTSAGAKFLESSPIRLDAAPRSAGAPMNRILWSVQAGVVLATLGIGLNILSGRTSDEGAQVLLAFGILTIAIGIGLILSAVAAYVISRRTGLIDRPLLQAPADVPGAETVGDRR